MHSLLQLGQRDLHLQRGGHSGRAGRGLVGYTRHWLPGQGGEQAQALQRPGLDEHSGGEPFLFEFSVLDILGAQCGWVGGQIL